MSSHNSGMFSWGRCQWWGRDRRPWMRSQSMTSGSVADCPCARHHRTVADIVPERPELRSMGCPRPRVHRQLVASSRRCDSTPHPSGSRAFSRFMRPWKSSARADLPSRRIDIGVVGTRDIPSTYGGYETFLTALLPELVSRGHRVTAYIRHSADRSQGESFRGVRRVPVRSMDTKQLSTISAGFSASFAAIRSRHDVVLAVNVANAIPLAPNRWMNQPVVLNTDGQEWIRGKWGKAARAVFRLSATVAGRTATALVSDSVEMRRIYLSDFKAGSTVIPSPLAPTCRPRQTQRRLFDASAWSPGRYFVTAGRLIPENRADWIAKAYVAASVDQPLLVLGTANYELAGYCSN